MKLNKKSRVLAVGGLSLALVAGAAAMTATAAVQSNGSDGPIHIYTDGGEFLDAAGYVYAWEEGIIASADRDDPMAGELSCPVGTTGAYTFVTAPGSERTGTDGWGAYSPNSVTATNGVFLANITPVNQIGHETLKSAGGTLSLGVACTIDNGVNVSAAYYRTIQVTAGTGAYTMTAVDTEVPPVEPPAEGTTGDIALAPSTMDAVNGTLALSVPADAAATFNAPTLVGNQSTTTGTLPEVKVLDGRVITAEGWTLTASVQDFVNAANPADIISKTQLGVAPAIVAANTTSTGAVVGTTQVAGSAAASYTFAEAPAGVGTGDTALNGGLTFVAPQSKAAGTYESTMTLTVVSK